MTEHVLTVGVLLMFVTNSTSAAQAEPTQEEIEERAKEAILAGKLVDLGNIEGKVSKKLVDFIEDVLSEKIEARVGRSGVRIVNARFPKVDWSYAEFEYPVRFENCQFDGVDFSNARFGGGLNLQRSTLASSDESPKALFAGMIVEGSADFGRVRFERASTVSFAGARIGNDFDGREARFNATEVVFEHLSVGGDARYEYAKFNGIRLSFTDLKVKGVTSFKGAVFKGRPGGSPISFARMEVGEVDFELAEFTGDVRFDNIVADKAFFGDARFDGGFASFVQARTKTDLVMDRASFLSLDGTVEFNQLQVGHVGSFTEARFCGPVSFAQTSVMGDFGARGARFYSGSTAPPDCTSKVDEAGRVDFGGLAVGKHMNLDHAVFDRRVSFVRATVGGDMSLNRARVNAELHLGAIRVGSLSAEGTRFRGRTILAGSTVDGEARFYGAVFSRDLQLERAAVGQDLDARFATFATADFTSAEVRGRLRTENASFSGRVTFDSASIHGDWQGSGALFQDDAEFSRLVVKGNVAFTRSTGDSGRNVVFEREARFDEAVVGREFDVSEAVFHDDVSFRSLTVKRTMKLLEVEFQRASSFEEAEIEGDLDAAGAVFHGLANFDGAHFGTSASFQDAEFLGPAELVGVVVESQTRFDDTTFSERVLLTNASLGTLSLNRTAWPAGMVDLEDISFDKLLPGEGGWDPVLQWLRDADYSPKAYQQLEALAASEEDSKLDAEDVYVEMMHHQRSTMEPDDRIADIALEYFVFFGRKPYLAFFWSGIVILFGVAVYFDPKDVQPRDTPDVEESRLQQFDALFTPSLSNHGPFRPYNPFWYSLDLFLPFVKLNAANLWMPRQDQLFRRHYARVHTILGWVLIPVALASVTGLVK